MNATGSALPRVDAPGKTTGKTLYTADYSAPEMLHVVLVRAKVAAAFRRRQ